MLCFWTKEVLSCIYIDDFDTIHDFDTTRSYNYIHYILMAAMVFHKKQKITYYLLVLVSFSWVNFIILPVKSI